jgi:hypothetical protein
MTVNSGSPGGVLVAIGRATGVGEREVSVLARVQMEGALYPCRCLERFQVYSNQEEY